MMVFSAQLAEGGGAPSPLHSIYPLYSIYPAPSTLSPAKLVKKQPVSPPPHNASLPFIQDIPFPLYSNVVGQEADPRQPSSFLSHWCPLFPRGLYSRENRGLALGQLYKPQAGSWVNQNKHFKLNALDLFSCKSKH
jgi:hypothetical protein